MKILIKFPSRARGEQFLHVLSKYVNKAKDTSALSFLITADVDDESMVSNEIHIKEILRGIEHKVIYGKSDNKIHAVNRDMELAGEYDILLLASDDMHPVLDGYDEVIRLRMKETYPDLDGVLWFNDGHAEKNLNTLVCMGKAYYNRFGYIYNPIYKSFFCDNEFMDVANRLGKQTYFSECIIEHKHPSWDKHIPEDELYKVNQKYWEEDERTYLHNIDYRYDLSVLIVSIRERHTLLMCLLQELRKQKAESGLRIEILTNIDNREKPIGKKRSELIHRARGKYCCFIDDDDEVSPFYFEEIEKALKSGTEIDCVSMLGMLYENGRPQKPFVHSINFDTYFSDEDGHYRPPNHLNPILTGYVRRIGFVDTNKLEDCHFALRLANAKLLKNEAKVERILYHYFYVNKPTDKLSEEEVKLKHDMIVEHLDALTNA